MTKKLFIIFTIVFVFFEIYALDPDRYITQYKIDIWKSENGLPQNYVRTILQTSDGYLWFGTEEGLVRFDGVKFAVFDDNNTKEIKNNFIFFLFEDSKKNLWIGTRSGGLLKYKDSKFKLYTEKDGLTSNTIYSICEGRNGDIWVGTDEGGLFKFNNNTFENYTVKDNLPDNKIYCICYDSRGNLWIGTRDGLSCFKNNKFSNYHKRDGIPHDLIRSLYEDHEGNLFVGTEKGLCKMENGRFDKVSSKKGPLSDRVNAIFEDRDNNMWIGTAKHGLIRLKDKTFSKLTKKNGLSDNYVFSITEDREGNLWVGTPYGGLNCLKNGKFKVFGKKEGLTDDIVFPVCEDSKGYLWIGTNNGLNRYKNGELIKINTSDGLSNNVINAIYEDSSGFIWVGTEDGLNQLESKKLKIFNRGKFIRNKYVISIYEGQKGFLWVGTQKGIFKKKGLDGEWITKKNGLTSNIVSFVYEDKQNNIWIGTYRGGLIKCVDGKYKYYNKKKDLVSDSLNCIYEDTEGVLWIGTINGLIRLENEMFTNYTKKNGMFNNNIYKILEDNRGYLWMSCNKGIFKVFKKELNDFAEGKINKISSIPYGKDDGMRSSECNGGFQSAGCKTNNGILLFPTIKGVVMIDPDKISLNKIPPPVIIEKILLNGDLTGLNKVIEVKPGINRIEVFFTALSFVSSKKLRFKHRLIDLEKDWVNINTFRDRVATYTSLPPGPYEFQVIACNNDGIWNTKGDSIFISIIPPFWKTWWFTLILGVAFAIVSYVVISFFKRYVAFSSFWKKQKHVGQYKLMEKIGVGGMGTIYRAHDLSDKSETVAIKILKEELFPDEGHRKRFKQEGAIIDQLNHPNIIKIFERGQHKQKLFIVMELLLGKTLDEKIKEENNLDVMDCLVIMVQVSDALSKIHSKGIIHRDLKPANIMLITKEGNRNFVKLLDFGLARTEFQSRVTQTGMVVGTINYLSPEQIASAEFSSASDIYSLGILFYEMTTGKNPFPGRQTPELMKQILDDIPEDPIDIRTDLPSGLNDLIMRMIEKEKEDRPDVNEVLEELRKIHQSLVNS